MTTCPPSLRSALPLALLASLSLTAACSGGSTGTLVAAIYGEEFIEEGLPASVFSDGWSVKFDKFLVSVGEMSWGKEAGVPLLSAAAFHSFDLVSPSAGMGQTITIGTVPEGKYPAVSYRLAPPPAGAMAGNATVSDKALLSQEGYAVYVVGTATKGAQSMKLDWGIDADVRFGNCESTAEIAGSGRSVITIHADHLFYDDLTSEEPNVTFDLMSTADANADGTITLAELTAVDITTLPNYQVGSKRLGAKTIENLGDFVRYLVTTVGHIDGEGHCQVTP